MLAASGRPLSGPRQDLMRSGFPVTDYEQPAALLGHAELRRVEYLNPDEIVLFQVPEQVAVTAPATHVHDVLDDNPAWPEGPRMMQDQPRRVPAVLVPGPVSPRMCGWCIPENRGAGRCLPHHLISASNYCRPGRRSRSSPPGSYPGRSCAPDPRHRRRTRFRRRNAWHPSCYLHHCRTGLQFSRSCRYMVTHDACYARSSARRNYSGIEVTASPAPDDRTRPRSGSPPGAPGICPIGLEVRFSAARDLDTYLLEP